MKSKEAIKQLRYIENLKNKPEKIEKQNEKKRIWYQKQVLTKAEQEAQRTNEHNQISNLISDLDKIKKAWPNPSST